MGKTTGIATTARHSADSRGSAEHCTVDSLWTRDLHSRQNKAFKAAGSTVHLKPDAAGTATECLVSVVQVRSPYRH
ncbi:hypothetical protein D3C76_1721530 [compost metagenome]